jgi:hypothetical protein
MVTFEPAIYRLYPMSYRISWVKAKPSRDPVIQTLTRLAINAICVQINKKNSTRTYHWSLTFLVSGHAQHALHFFGSAAAAGSTTFVSPDSEISFVSPDSDILREIHQLVVKNKIPNSKYTLHDFQMQSALQLSLTYTIFEYLCKHATLILVSGLLRQRLWFQQHVQP